MLNDMNFEVTWQAIMADDRLKFIARQQWEMAKYIETNTKNLAALTKRVEELEDVPKPAATVAPSSIIPGVTGGGAVAFIVIGFYEVAKFFKWIP